MPEIHKSGHKRISGTGGFLFLRGDLGAQSQNIFFAETQVGAADFVDVKLARLKVFFQLRLVDFEKSFHFVDGKHVVHTIKSILSS